MWTWLVYGKPILLGDRIAGYGNTATYVITLVDRLAGRHGGGSLIPSSSSASADDEMQRNLPVAELPRTTRQFADMAMDIVLLEQRNARIFYDCVGGSLDSFLIMRCSFFTKNRWHKVRTQAQLEFLLCVLTHPCVGAS